MEVTAHKKLGKCKFWLLSLFPFFGALALQVMGSTLPALGLTVTLGTQTSFLPTGRVLTHTHSWPGWLFKWQWGQKALGEGAEQTRD